MVEKIIKDAFMNGHYADNLHRHIDDINLAIYTSNRTLFDEIILKTINYQGNIRSDINRLISKNQIQTYPSILASFYSMLKNKVCVMDHPEKEKISSYADYWSKTAKEISNPLVLGLKLNLVYTSFLNNLNSEHYSEAKTILKNIKCDDTRALVAYYGTDLLKEKKNIEDYLHKIKELMKLSIEKYFSRAELGDQCANLIYLVKEIVSRGNNVALEEVIRRFEEGLEDHIAQKKSKQDLKIKTLSNAHHGLL